jgi:UDP-glucose 4-epimerase
MAPLNILVTGATGYIGAALIHHLRGRGHRLVAIVGPHSDVACLPEIDILRLDGGDNSRLAGSLAAADTLVHLAGFKGAEQCRRELPKVIDANILFLRKLLEFNRNDALRLIFASTYWVYGHKGPVPYREAQPIMPSEPYGWSKALAEQMVRTSGLPYIIVRLANVFGYGMGSRYDEVTSLFLNRALRGEAINLRNRGEHCLDLVNIADVCEVLTKLMEIGHRDLILNVGSGRPTALRQLAEEVNQIALELTARSAAIILGPKEDDPISFADRWVSLDKLQSHVEFIPTPLPLALREFAQKLLIRRIP